MAQSEAAPPAQKRGPGRPAKTPSQPAAKKRKISTTISTPASSAVQSPAHSSPALEEKPVELPSRVSARRALPTLPQPQPVTLSKEEYKSIAASAVLQHSLDRSRLRWVHDGVLERYWVKPETGKTARPTPPNNPELKWQKHKGPCRIRIEPHILEAEMYVEEKAKPPPPPPVKQYAPPGYGYHAVGAPYLPNHAPYKQQQFYQGRAMAPVHQHGANAARPMGNMSHSPAPSQPSPRPGQPAQQSPASTKPDKKGAPDPVISMLATRASSDPELKALMKEVATGNASQEQLKVFQGHIDELNKIVHDKKKQEEGEAAATGTTAAPLSDTANSTSQQPELIQYDGAADQAQPFSQQRPYQPPAPAYQQTQHQPWQAPPPLPAPAPPPAPTALPVILAFTTTGATEDRFLFPRYSIIEALSPQHLLASFIVTRKGGDAADKANLDPEKEYWQPVTLMVEVAYNREHLLECVRKWIKPVEEVKKHMEEVIARCTKASDAFLALRLPFKSNIPEDPDDLDSVDGLPVPEKKPRKPYTKRSSLLAKQGETTPAAATPAQEKKDGAIETPVAGAILTAPAAANASETSKDTVQQTGQETAKEAAAESVPDVAPKVEGETAPKAESERPKRSTRKSVRISEG